MLDLSSRSAHSLGGKCESSSLRSQHMSQMIPHVTRKDIA
jgi:hypothetical protein